MELEPQRNQDDVADIEDEAIEKSGIPESPEESVRQALLEIEEHDPTQLDTGNQSEKNSETEAEGKAPPSASTEEATKAQEEQIAPPHDWTVTGKEWFHKLPKEAKSEISRASKEYQAHTTKLWQELNRGVEEYGELKQVVDHYIPKWNVRGLTAPQAIAQLAAANDLILQNPVHGISMLLRSSGVSVEQISDYLKNGGTQTPSQQQPQNSGLNSEIQELYNWKRNLEQQEEERAVSAIVREVSSVRDELDQSGRYRYPKLHDPQFLQRVQRLVSALKETDPQVSWADATRRAYGSLEGNQGSPSLQKPRLSQAATSEQIARARQASVAARTRGGSGSLSGIDDAPIKGRETPEESVRLVLRSLGRV